MIVSPEGGSVPEDVQKPLSGTVKWFNKEKGFGFISMPEDQLDVFLHANQLRRAGIQRSLQPGERILFVPEKGKKGIMATQVVLPDEPTVKV